jgi:D-ribose pyranose/furanose isomerase RbsD
MSEIMDYEKFLEIYGVDVEIKEIVFDTDRYNFRGVPNDKGIYIKCWIRLEEEDSRGLPIKEEVLIHISKLFSLATPEVIAKTLFREMMINGLIEEEEVEEHLNYYKRVDKIIDSIFNKNNLYGISYEDFSKMIFTKKLINRIDDLNRVSTDGFY